MSDPVSSEAIEEYIAHAVGDPDDAEAVAGCAASLVNIAADIMMSVPRGDTFSDKLIDSYLLKFGAERSKR